MGYGIATATALIERPPARLLLDAHPDRVETRAGRMDLLLSERGHRDRASPASHRPATIPLDDRGVLVNPESAAAGGPGRHPVVNPLRGEAREEVEVRDDEVPGQDIEAVANRDRSGKPILVEVVGGVALLAQHH